MISVNRSVNRPIFYYYIDDKRNMASSTISSKKVFGYCKVEWHIDNFFLQTVSKDWKIQSSEFTVKGSEDTNWCMDLRPVLINENSYVSFSLTRSSVDSSPKYIWLNLNVYLVCSNLKPICCNNLFVLKNDSKCEILLGSVDYLLSEVKQLDDSFTLVCDMIVYSKSTNSKFGDCSNPTVKLLSENMLDLYNSARKFDIKLVFSDNVILAHKSILCARNSYLSSMIEENNMHAQLEEVQEYITINFSNKLDYKAMRKILAYLYTGDIRHVLEQPSFDIHNCATFLGIREIIAHYEPEEFILKSNLDFKEYTYILRGYDFEKSNFIWSFDQGTSINMYRLLFLPNKENVDEYIQLFSKEFTTPIIACFTLKFADICDHLCTASFIIKKNVSVDINTIIGAILRKLNFTNQVYEVVLNLKISTGVTISYVEEHVAVSVKSISNDFYYYRLVSDMDFLLHHGSSTDLIIISSDSTFFLHKCILASRSTYFSDLFMGRNQSVISLPIDGLIFYAVLVYIYTGLLPITGSNDVIELYKISIFLKLPQLKSVCTDRLIVFSISDRYIRCLLVRVAEEYEDHCLKKSVLNHMFDDKNETIILSNNLAFFQDIHTCWRCS